VLGGQGSFPSARISPKTRPALGSLGFNGKNRSMKSYLIAAMAACSLSVPLTSHADLRDQWDVQTGMAELVIPGMQPQDVANQVKSALAQFAIPANLNFRPLPSEIPARPDEPVRKQVFIQGAPVVELQCPTAYAEITKQPPPVQNAFAFIGEYLQSCLYSFEGGVKVYLIMTRAKKTESLTSGLFNGLTKAIQGTDGERIASQLKGNIEDIRKNIPSLLVEKVEVPGMPVQEPDKAAVAALIPPKPAVVKQTTPSSQTTVQVVAAPPVTAQQGKIEARKNLTGMGMTYHSQENFIAAIRRKDDVAVQLYLDGEGIDPTAKDSKGKTPLEIAQEAGAADVAKLISNHLSKPAAKVPGVLEVQAKANMAPPTGLAVEQKPSGKAATLEPEMLAELNGHIDKLNIPADQKEAMRANAIRQILQIKAMANGVNSQTGALQ
jgi:hypothetical protein